MLTAAKTSLRDAAATPVEADRDRGQPRATWMASLHHAERERPSLRGRRPLLEIDRTGSISAAAERCAIREATAAYSSAPCAEV